MRRVAEGDPPPAGVATDPARNARRPEAGARRRRRRSRRLPPLGQILWGRSAGATPQRSAREWGHWLVRAHLLPLGSYLLIAAAMTYPLVLRFGDAVVGNDFDAWQNIWNFWWARIALTGGQSPFQTPLLYAPDGAPLYLHTLNLFNGLLSLPFQPFGIVAAYNTVVLLSLTLSAHFTALLVAEVSGSRRAGWLGGLIYGFSAYQMNHLFYGQTNLLAAEWLPLYLLCLLRAGGAIGRKRTGYTIAAAAAMFAITLCDWQYVIFAMVLTGLWAAWATVARRDGVALTIAAATGTLWALAAAPILLLTLATLRGGITAYVTEDYLIARSADLLSLVAPGSRQRWWGWLTARATGLAPLGGYAQGEYLGFLPLAFGALGVVLARRRASFWALVALVGAVLALGPTLQIAGVRQWGAGGWAVPLPYRLLASLPGLAIARVPTRYTLIATLALAVLAGLGLAALSRRIGPRLSPPAGLALTAVLALAILGEQLTTPYPAVSAQPPGFARFLATAPGAGTVLMVPFSFEEPRALYWQTIHGRPMIAGYLSRPLNDPLLTLPPFAPLVNARRPPDIIAPDHPELPGQVLRFAEVRWIVADRTHAQPEREPLASFLAAHAEPTPAYADERFRVYTTRPASPPTTPPLAIRVGPGWHEPEPLAGTPDRMRWLAGDGTIHAWNLGATGEQATLRFATWSFAGSQRLAVSVDGRDLGTWPVSDLREITIPLALAPGRHQIILRALNPPISPAALGRGTDPRPLTVGVARVTLER